MGNILQSKQSSVKEFIILEEKENDDKISTKIPVILYVNYTPKYNILSSPLFKPGNIYNDFKELFLRPITYFKYNKYVKIPGGRGWCFPKSRLNDVRKLMTYKNIEYNTIDFNKIRDLCQSY